jgi:Thiamine pyrophosphate enzyme, C-terminal TPP binding domain
VAPPGRARRVLPPGTIVALDAGAAPAYGYDRLSFARPRTFLAPIDLGGLGFAFPVALGAKLGRPEAPVIAVHGDGGFLMNSQEIETAVRHHIGVVTIVMNNNCWRSEKAHQKHSSELVVASSAPPATTSSIPIRSATRSKRRSARARPPSSRFRSTPTSSRLRRPRSAARTRSSAGPIDAGGYS